MQAAAEAGNRLAQFNFAPACWSSVTRAARRLAKAAALLRARGGKRNLPMRNMRCRSSTANGAGGKRATKPSARQWLERAAKQNFDTAQLDLATWMIDGRGGPRDSKGGFAWMKRAAEGGNVAAQNRLAKLYMEGHRHRARQHLRRRLVPRWRAAPG